MNKTLLSICIPTYNRAKRVYQCLKHLISFNDQNIEFVVSDDGSIDYTAKKVNQLKDERIKYFHNKKNLGQELNVIKTFQRARGKFLFLISDEDYIELKNLPYIIRLIKENENITQILGAIWNDNNNKLYYNPGNKRYKKGPESLLNLIYNHGYISGVILKKKPLDLKTAKKYIGSSYIHLYLSTQAMLKGDTICTSRIICHIGKPEQKATFEEFIPKSKGKILFNHPKSRIIQIIFQFRQILKITKNLPKLRKRLLNLERKKAANLVATSCFSNNTSLHPILNYIFTLPLILKLNFIAFSRIYCLEISKIFIKKYLKKII